MKDSRIEGTYKVTYIRLSSNIQGTKKRETSRWTITPHCNEGACDVKVHSDNRWKSKALLLSDTYRFSRRVGNAYTCEVGGRVIYDVPAVYEYSFEPRTVRAIDGTWIAATFDGELRTEGIKSCSGTLREKFALRARLLGAAATA